MTSYTVHTNSPSGFDGGLWGINDEHAQNPADAPQIIDRPAPQGPIGLGPKPATAIRAVADGQRRKNPPKKKTKTNKGRQSGAATTVKEHTR